MGSFGCLAPSVDAQLRGLPVFLESQFAYDGRISLDVGHAGEVDGLAAAGSASYLVWIGNCKRVAVSAGAGILNPGGGDFEAHFNGGGGVSVLLNPCPDVFSIPNPAVWLVGGVGLVDMDGETAVNVPLGIGVAYKVEISTVQIEPWIVPRLHYREPLTTTDDADWDFAVSTGVTLGLGGEFGLRVAVDCCEDGIGIGYRVSRWF
jgi:hypothetical protein